MIATLIDTGPIVAFLSRRDRHHDWAVEMFAAHAPPLLTCEAVLSEAAFLLNGFPGGGARVAELAERGVLSPTFRLGDEIGAVKTLMKRYQDVRIDLADACLIRMSELHADCILLTLDSEFRDVYRRRGRHAIPTAMPSAGRRSRR